MRLTLHVFNLTCSTGCFPDLQIEINEKHCNTAPLFWPDMYYHFRPKIERAAPSCGAFVKLQPKHTVLHQCAVFEHDLTLYFSFLSLCSCLFALRMVIPLFDDDTGLLVLAGTVRYRLMLLFMQSVRFQCGTFMPEKFCVVVSHIRNPATCVSVSQFLSFTTVCDLMISVSQGDTVVDCFEVSTSEPLLSQGKAR